MPILGTKSSVCESHTHLTAFFVWRFQRAIPTIDRPEIPILLTLFLLLLLLIIIINSCLFFSPLFLLGSSFCPRPFRTCLSLYFFSSLPLLYFFLGRCFRFRNLLFYIPLVYIQVYIYIYIQCDVLENCGHGVYIHRHRRVQRNGVVVQVHTRKGKSCPSTAFAYHKKLKAVVAMSVGCQAKLTHQPN